jgi:putative transposase
VLFEAQMFFSKRVRKPKRGGYYMTKQEFLEKYGEQELLEIKFCVYDLVDALPDDFEIGEDDIPMFLRGVSKGMESGMMEDWTLIAEIAVETAIVMSNMNRPLPSTPKTVRIIRKADGWYAMFTCEVEPQVLPPTGKEIGVDVGVASLVTTSDGEKVANPKWYRAGQKKLRRLQRSLSRKQPGGKNREKARQAVARHHLHVSRQRQDALNKIVYKLIQEYDFIAVEDLNIRGMVKNRGLSKSIMDAGWGYFKERLFSKAAEAGRLVVAVNPANMSQTCSSCGQLFPEKIGLSVRTVRCSCGLELDRDVNAAINILRLGRSRWASTSAAAGVAQEAAGL